MTMPIWAAFPPEVNSAALTTGPGPGSLLTSEAAWLQLSAEYDTAAAELSDLLAEVQAGTWQGPTAEAFVAAHVPYLAWLLQNSSNSSAAALEHDTVIAAYDAAVAAMPTLAEIAANKALNAELEATNFFGVNTIPIAVNEFDYLQMWLRAATAMAIYEAVSETALTWVQPTAPPPAIQLANPPNQDAGGGADQLSWWVTRVQEVAQELTTDLNQPGSTPSTAIHSLLTDPLLLKVPHWAGESLYTFIPPQVPQLAQASYALLAPALAVVSAPGLAGLAGVAQPVPAAMPVAAAAPAPSATHAPVAMAPGLSAPAATPAVAPAPAPAAATPASVAVHAPPPPAAVPASGFPYVVGPPGIGAGGQMAAAARTEQRAAQPDAVAPVAAAAKRAQVRSRRQRPGQIDPGHRYEYLDQAAENVTASDRGAGSMGFAGTAPEAGAAAGLTRLAGDSLGGGPRVPMLPSTWPIDGESPGGKS